MRGSACSRRISVHDLVLTAALKMRLGTPWNGGARVQSRETKRKHGSNSLLGAALQIQPLQQ
jgi:hypothetical protein